MARPCLNYSTFEPTIDSPSCPLSCGHLRTGLGAEPLPPAVLRFGGAGGNGCFSGDGGRTSASKNRFQLVLLALNSLFEIRCLTELLWG